MAFVPKMALGELWGSKWAKCGPILPADRFEARTYG